ncbi:hypothetical protein CFP71_12450 [Amycolatopsis thailandensis]|uniref:PBP domain-containing protein n=1 Tax=Amycolatopsis thailandensis TaxID=589330 RepID=A0A229SCI6_9PSEU|nr:hypothetical protein [Amycolatopsis thailandensis]OXM56637.1 hypothetical protein CFP71_12450 [Amycolatopsis thailandensis]
MVLVRARRVGIVLICGILAVAGVSVPAAQAQAAADPAYRLKTEPADLSAVQNGDPLRITLSGLPKGARAKLVICPKDVPDNLMKKVYVPPWNKDSTVLTRVQSYCQDEFGDEFAGKNAGMQSMERVRSSTTGDIVFDTTIPRGTLRPHAVAWDPLYTTYEKAVNPGDKFPKVPWADNPAVVDPATGAKTRRQFSFTCDENNPCSVTIQITAQDATGKTVTWVDDSIKFSPYPPGIGVKGCKGIGRNTLDASMPERLGRTAVAWNQALCAPTKADQPTNIVSETEETGLTAFDKGASDLMITGSGSALAAQTVRAREYVPVGINAAVIAAVGWSPTDVNDEGNPLGAKLAGTMAFTNAELANMLTKGGQNPDAGGRGGIFKTGSPLVGRNAGLSAIKDGQPAGVVAANRRSGYNGSADFFGVTGESGPGTVPLTLSRLLAGTAPKEWVFPALGDDYFGELNGKSPGVISDLSVLDPGRSRVNNVDAKTGQLSVRKTVDNAVAGRGSDCDGGCVNWVITDLATATINRWTPVALPDGKGNFVAPTEQSLQTAVDAMKIGADGTAETGAVAKDGAYPVTFVEYMAVPVNPLIDANCKPMKEKQDQLKSFAGLAAGYGQALLPPGMVRLNPGLAATAAERIAKIGTGTVEKACQEKEEAKNPPPPGANGVTPASTPSLGGPSGGQGSSAGTPVTAAVGPVPAVAPTPESVAAAKNLAESIDIPKFAGAGALGALIPLVALVILAILPSATAYVSAGRPVPAWLTRAIAVLLGLLRRKPSGGVA